MSGRRPIHSWRNAGAALLFCLALLAGTPARAETTIECGPLKGTAYRFENALIDKAHSGWGNDAMDNGSFLIVVDEEATDIHFRDSSGKVDSLRSQGFQIVRLQTLNPDFISLIAVHTNGVLEHYLVKKSANSGELVYYQSRFGDHQLTASRLMKASCKL